MKVIATRVQARLHAHLMHNMSNKRQHIRGPKAKCQRLNACHVFVVYMTQWSIR